MTANPVHYIIAINDFSLFCDSFKVGADHDSIHSVRLKADPTLLPALCCCTLHQEAFVEKNGNVLSVFVEALFPCEDAKHLTFKGHCGKVRGKNSYYCMKD